MPTVKILLGDVPTEWRSILSELAEEDDEIQIIGEALDPVDILVKVKNLKVNVVVLSQTPEGGEPGICSHILLEYPNLPLILVPLAGGPNVLCRLMQKRDTREASKEALDLLLRQHDQYQIG